MLWHGGGCGTEVVLWHGGSTMAWGRLWHSGGCGMVAAVARWQLWHVGSCGTGATVAGSCCIVEPVARGWLQHSSGLLQLFLLGQFSLLGQNISKVLVLLIMLRQFSYWGKNQ